MLRLSRNVPEDLKEQDGSLLYPEIHNFPLTKLVEGYSRTTQSIAASWYIDRGPVHPDRGKSLRRSTLKDVHIGRLDYQSDGHTGCPAQDEAEYRLVLRHIELPLLELHERVRVYRLIANRRSLTLSGSRS